MDVAQLAIQVNSAPAVKAVGDLDRLTVAAGKADAAADRLAANTNRVGPAMAGAGQNSRMFAMQLSQVAQQTSATGNFIQALAIQLPDMALGFGAAGIAAGILASIALPMLASAFMSTGEEGKALQDSLDSLSESAEAYRAALENLRTPSDELIAKYGTMTEAARNFAAALMEIERVSAFEGLTQSIDQLTAPLLALRDVMVDEFGQEIPGTANWRFLAEELGVAENNASALASALMALDTASGPAKQAEAANRLAELLMSAAGSYSAMSAEARAVYDATVQIGNAAADVQGATEDAASAATRLERNMADAYGLYAATRDMASQLATETERAAMAAASLAYGKLSNEGGMDAVARATMRETTPNPFGRLASGAGGVARPSSGGGGGGGVDQFAQELEALTQRLQSEREILDAWYEESQTILADRRAQEILGEEAHKAALLDVELEYQRQLAEIEGTSQNQRLSDTATFFGALANVASAGGQKTAKAVAAFQAIEGTINAYGAAIKALNTPGITLAGRFAAYASVLAAGLRGVAAIKSAGGVAGGAGGGAIAAQGATTQPLQQQEFIVRGIDRDQLYTGDMLARIFDGITEEAQKRGVQIVTRFA